MRKEDENESSISAASSSHAAILDFPTFERKDGLDPGSVEHQHSSEHAEEQESAFVALGKSTGLGWVTSNQGGQDFSNYDHPPALVFGVSGTVEIGYDLDMTRVPNGWYKAKASTQDQPHIVDEKNSQLERSSTANVEGRHDPPNMKPLNIEALRSHLRQHTVAQASRLLNVQASCATGRRLDIQLRGGNMLYLQPRIIKPWYTYMSFCARGVEDSSSERSHTTSRLALASVKAQWQLCEVIAFCIAALFHFAVIIYISFGNQEGAVFERTDTNAAISNYGTMSLFRSRRAESHYWISICIASSGVLAILLQVPEVTTCYIIGSGIGTAIMFTLGLSGFHIFLPILQAVMVYCAFLNRRRHLLRVVVVDTSF